MPGTRPENCAFDCCRQDNQLGSTNGTPWNGSLSKPGNSEFLRKCRLRRATASDIGVAPAGQTMAGMVMPADRIGKRRQLPEGCSSVVQLSVLAVGLIC
jgi:hypothetical protein